MGILTLVKPAGRVARDLSDSSGDSCIIDMTQWDPKPNQSESTNKQLFNEQFKISSEVYHHIHLPINAGLVKIHWVVDKFVEKRHV